MTAVAPALTTTPPAKPFVKWVGGKRQLLPQILAHVPERFSAYHEPFLGGGALFFALRSAISEACPRAYLSDANARLIRTYRGVRDSAEEVARLLRTYPYDRNFFKATREIAIDSASDAEVAAWFIYLNKTGFNGLYRVNRRGQFNVPFGRYTNPTICDAENLRACSGTLQGAKEISSTSIRRTSRSRRRSRPVVKLVGPGRLRALQGLFNRAGAGPKGRQLEGVWPVCRRGGAHMVRPALSAVNWRKPWRDAA